MIATEKSLTGEALLELQRATGKRYELVKGIPVETMPAGGKHGYIASKIERKLGTFVEERHLGFVFTAETGVYLERNPDTVRGADVTFVSRTKIHAYDDIDSGFLTAIPDLVVEVVSQPNQLADALNKVQEWRRAGVSEVWLVDAERKTVSVYSNDGVQTLNETDTLVGKNLLDGFSLPIKTIFS
ncbi:MAG: Uma2 family endonuclease [Chloroherpetonaceae bacterium]|nr:Uma2 family endonuclease [Chloroherpetonaceae bacterium]MDW8436688.1 Uma2 family endonuclease [Chloroherpetonaceae bacterium]